MKHTKLVLLCLFEWDFDGKNIVTLCIMLKLKD